MIVVPLFGLGLLWLGTVCPWPVALVLYALALWCFVAGLQLAL